MALLVNPECVRDELRLLWRREMVVGSYTPRWVKVRSPQGDCDAITFAMNRDHQSYRGRWSIHKVARTIANATGALGSNAEYLFDTLNRLEELHLKDHGLTDLAERVRRIQKSKVS